jgi:hypothetical protein
MSPYLNISNFGIPGRWSKSNFVGSYVQSNISQFYFEFPFQFVIILKRTTKPHPNVIRFDKEKSFLNPQTGKEEKFPSIVDEPTIDLSVVVPAYDEEERRK